MKYDIAIYSDYSSRVSRQYDLSKEESAEEIEAFTRGRYSHEEAIDRVKKIPKGDYISLTEGFQKLTVRATK